MKRVADLMSWLTAIMSVLCQGLTARWRSMSVRCTLARMAPPAMTMLPNTRVSVWLVSWAKTARSTLMNVPVRRV